MLVTSVMAGIEEVFFWQVDSVQALVSVSNGGSRKPPSTVSLLLLTLSRSFLIELIGNKTAVIFIFKEEHGREFTFIMQICFMSSPLIFIIFFTHIKSGARLLMP